MATVKVWYHTAAQLDAHGHPIPVLDEPSLNANDQAEVVTTPGVTSAAPVSSEFAFIETDLLVRYTVRRAGQTSPDADENTKYVGVGQNQIAIRPGQTIHFVEG